MKLSLLPEIKRLIKQNRLADAAIASIADKSVKIPVLQLTDRKCRD